MCADVGSLVPGRKVIDYVSALLEFEGGARGTFTVTQAAAGGENDIRLRVYGEKGMLEWSHREASYLRVALQGEPVRVVGRGDAVLPPEIVALGRTPRGHPEGLARGVREHLRRGGAGADGARARRDAAGVPLPAHRGRRAHDGVHRGVPRVAGERRAGSTSRRFPNNQRRRPSSAQVFDGLRMIRIGTAGWALPAPLRGSFPGDDTHLGRYGRVFTATEITHPFHRAHRQATYARWAASVRPISGFR